MKLSITHPEYLKYRNSHERRVMRDTENFMRFYDEAAKAVFSGKDKKTVVDELAPLGCEQTQVNGIFAGACQAARLLRFEKTKVK